MASIADKSRIASRFEGFSDRIESFIIVRTIKRALTILIPVLMIGSFALIISSFPISAYQDFLKTEFGKVIFNIADVLFESTFGKLSLYMSLSIGYCLATDERRDSYYIFGSMLTSLIGFFISVGAYWENFNNQYLGVNGMFMAILASILSSILYRALYKRRKITINVYTDGANYTYSSAIASIFPMLIIFLVFSLVQYIIVHLLGVSCVQEIFVIGLNNLFFSIDSKFLQGILFVIISSILWIFGIHGSDILNSINEGIFTDYMQQNVDAVSNGVVPPNILSKTFIDVFVLMGGCGVTICLLAAIVIFAKQANNRRLAKTAALPMLFNINELMVFGLPIIYSPILFIPFILTPIAAFLTSYGAMATGLVPLPTVTVEWTTPILLSGYMATNSIAGSVLQLFNFVLGIAIYAPFVKLKESEQILHSQKLMNRLVSILQKSENENKEIILSKLPGELNGIVKMLTLDLNHALQDKKLELYYQPQFNRDMQCTGAEALLRWKHSSFGIIYPPLIIKLADEENLLTELEQYILQRVAGDTVYFKNTSSDDFYISVNLTAKTLQTDNILPFLEKLKNDFDFPDGFVCIEITEQSALNMSGDVSEKLKKVHDMGYLLAIDDFSMGHTSLKYLQDNSFDHVKLDGSLVKGLRENDRCQDIIKSIVYLSKSLNFTVLAEYVETKEQMNDLVNIGCFNFQGWLYSKAITRDEFLEFTKAYVKAEK